MIDINRFREDISRLCEDFKGLFFAEARAWVVTRRVHFPGFATATYVPSSGIRSSEFEANTVTSDTDETTIELAIPCTVPEQDVGWLEANSCYVFDYYPPLPESHPTSAGTKITKPFRGLSLAPTDNFVLERCTKASLASYLEAADSGKLPHHGWMSSHDLTCYGRNAADLLRTIEQTNNFMSEHCEIWDRLLFDGRNMVWDGLAWADLILRVADIARIANLDKPIWKCAFQGKSNLFTNRLIDLMSHDWDLAIKAWTPLMEIPDVIYYEWSNIIRDSETVLKWLLDNVIADQNKRGTSQTKPQAVESNFAVANRPIPDAIDAIVISIPELNKNDGSWILASSEAMRTLSGCSTKTLRTSRSRSHSQSTRNPQNPRHWRSADGLAGIECGRMWRCDPKDQQTVWYLKSSVKVLKTERKATKTRHP